MTITDSAASFQGGVFRAGSVLPGPTVFQGGLVYCVRVWGASEKDYGGPSIPCPGIVGTS